MENKPDTGIPTDARPAGDAAEQNTVNQIKATLDRTPVLPKAWVQFAQLPAPERSAVYLRSIRTMIALLIVLTVLGILIGVVLAVIGIHAIDQHHTYG